MVPAYQQAPNDFTPVKEALNMCAHTFQITDNQKHFREYDVNTCKTKDGTIVPVIVISSDSLTGIVRQEAREIYHLLVSSNDINVKKTPELIEERLQRQQRAIDLCNILLIDIQICQKRFHMTKSKAAYWARLVDNTLNATIRWHAAELAKFK